MSALSFCLGSSAVVVCGGQGGNVCVCGCMCVNALGGMRVGADGEEQKRIAHLCAPDSSFEKLDPVTECNTSRPLFPTTGAEGSSFIMPPRLLESSCCLLEP